MMKRSRGLLIASVLLIAISATLVSAVPTSHAAATTSSKAPAITKTTLSVAFHSLTRDVAGYSRSLTSPFIDNSGHIFDVAVVESKGASGSTQLQVLEYSSRRWKVVKRIVLSPFYLARGHETVRSKSPSQWMELFSLGANDPAVKLYDGGASGWGGMIVGRVKGNWELVPFERWAEVELPNPNFVSKNDVVTSLNSCSPTCAKGKVVSSKYKFDPETGRFLLVKTWSHFRLTSMPKPPSPARY